MRILDLLSEEYIQIGDQFSIELDEDLVLESTVVDFLSDGPVIQGDDVLLSYLQTESLNEAEYQGRKVQLGKPFLTPDGPKKRSVYVRNSKGNVVKVNFGDKKMKIKKSNPERRKSFRARHNCDNPGPRTSARYWSCKFW